VGTDTIHFINVSQILKGQKATYLKIVAADNLNKSVKQRVRFTVGSNRVDYAGNCSTKTVDLTTARCLFNSVVSSPAVSFMTMDIRDFYLNTPMAKFEYIRIAVRYIPDTIMTAYNLADKIHNGHKYVEVQKGMSGLSYAGKIANNCLVQHLHKHGYRQAEHTHIACSHTTSGLG
jgi:hypothetical protein